jgi:hypothetical protein
METELSVNKIYYRFQNSQPRVPILSHINPIHALLYQFAKMYFNMIFWKGVIFLQVFSHYHVIIYISPYVLNSRNFNRFHRNFDEIFWGKFNLIRSLFSCFLLVAVSTHVKLRKLRKIRENKTLINSHFTAKNWNMAWKDVKGKTQAKHTQCLHHRKLRNAVIL